ncbi:hypothetical protein BASA81_004955 [Batrachochytrium salamandrivorans]|nr:hypothetical protein BASA81_004955 [Batrachochytrium salamandrivorans]
MIPSSNSLASNLTLLASQRHGNVLDSTTLLKVDEYRKHAKRQLWFPKHISGAEQLRMVNGIVGVAQPTVPGVRSILDYLGTGREPLLSSSKRTVLWINLREEPLLYLNGRTVVLRDKNEPFRNMETFKGISEQRLVELEWRLKEDVVEEAKRCGGSVLVHVENDASKNLEEIWESAPSQSVMTAEEMFFQFRHEGYRVKYKRIPCTSNQPPGFHFFDDLLQAMDGVDRDCWVVFNCQSGMVRSTLAMIAANAIQIQRGLGASNCSTPPSSDAELHDPSTQQQEDPAERQLLAGWYNPVLHLIRLLIDGGRRAKHQTDLAVDRFAHTNNLRREIFAMRSSAANARGSHMVRLAMRQAAVALQRYMLLILFQAYLNEATPQVKFVKWMDDRKELRLLLQSLEIDISSALEGPSTALSPVPKASVNDAELALEEEIRTILASRKGSMLNTDMIVKWDRVTNHHHNNFRQVPGMRVFGVATCDVNEFRHVIKRVQQSDTAIANVVVCNLREEPFVYINGKACVLRSVLRPFRNLDVFQDIDCSRLELAEDNMKREVLQEAQTNSNRVLVHNDNVAGMLKTGLEDVEDEDCVATPREVFERFALQEGLPVQYKRIPMTPEREPGLEDVEAIIQLVRRTKQRANSNTAFVFVCHQGRGRSTIATIIASLELDSIVGLAEEDQSESLKFIRGSKMPKMMSVLSEVVERTSTPATPPPMTAVALHRTASNRASVSGSSASGNGSSEDAIPLPIKTPPLPAAPHSALATSTNTDFSPLLSLCRVLPRGPTAKRWLDHTIDDCGQVYNLRHSALEHALGSVNADSAEHSQALLGSALFELRVYFLLLEIAGYCLECKMNGNNGNAVFKEWCLKRPELVTLKQDIQDISAFSLQQQQPQLPQLGATPGFETDYVVQERSGHVMVKGSILKTDHFTGCRRLPNPSVEIEGAPNFRSVWPEGPVDGIDLRAYGTGIPTQQGLEDILALLQGEGGDDRVTWVNLREEPILYCNGRPFVLRRMEEPFANLEHTGISQKRVEEMEIRMKQDIQEEARRHSQNEVLIHEEDDLGELVAKWERLDCVQTPKELFEQYKDKVCYYRIPITDEQSPKPTALDAILTIVSEASNTSHLVFNCQMGRGRTTTGLVVACAARLRKMGLSRRFPKVVREKITRRFRSRVRTQQPLGGEAQAELNGDFAAITAQVRLLDNGLEAKQVMDALIDVCDAMQNLREAVYDVKQRSVQQDLSPVLRHEAAQVAEHYLRRYSLLIQFSSFLLTINVSGPTVITAQRFAYWLKSRPELLNAWKSTVVAATAINKRNQSLLGY